MSRAHCLDCGTDVPVDPLGHCPEGHLLPAHGRRVESAIGSDDQHPDEPEPWVATVALGEAAEPGPHAPSAEPQAAPGMAPAERETSTGDLLRELGSLSEPDDPAPPPGGEAPSASASPPPAGPPTTSPDADRAPPGGPDTPPAPAGPDTAVSEHSALEQALQSLDVTHDTPAPPASPPSSPTGPAPSAPPADDLSSLFEELDGLGEDTHDDGGHAAPTTPPPAATPPPPPAAAPAPSEQPAPPTAPPPAGDDDRPTRRALREAGELASAPPEADEHTGNGHEAQAPARGLDTTNFTAKGGAMNGRRRRRLLGR